MSSLPFRRKKTIDSVSAGTDPLRNESIFQLVDNGETATPCIESLPKCTQSYGVSMEPVYICTFAGGNPVGLTEKWKKIISWTLQLLFFLFFPSENLRKQMYKCTNVQLHKTNVLFTPSTPWHRKLTVKIQSYLFHPAVHLPYICISHLANVHLSTYTLHSGTQYRQFNRRPSTSSVILFLQAECNIKLYSISFCGLSKCCKKNSEKIQKIST